MLPRPATTRQPLDNESTNPDASIRPTPPTIDIGVGIDTARYGHYVAFLDSDLQQAAPELEVAESAAGYAKLRERFTYLVNKQNGHQPVCFFVRLDVAGAYADNLLHFLHSLAQGADATPLANAEFSISCGDPQRNKNYRLSIFGNKKSDPIEARACARYAISERPKPMPACTPERQRLRHVALRLQAVVKQRTRLVNQLHQLLARTFPELALLVKDITTGWVLELLTRYPTARLLAQASAADLEAIPYLPHPRSDGLLSAARDSIATLDGDLAEQLLRDQVRQVRDIAARQKRLENLLISAYRALPEPNHLDTIKGFGEVTAGILTAFVADINAVHTPGQLVAYFGVMPIEVSSGFERDGAPRGPKRYVMSRRGNDLVRRYLWMAALTAARFNPACRALYAHVRAKHPDRPAIAIGHVMRKLLHLAFAIWKTGKPFDPNHYPWHKPAHLDRSNACKDGDGLIGMKPAAGLEPDVPAKTEVTATGESSLPAQAPAVDSLPPALREPLLSLPPALRGEGRVGGSSLPDHAYLDFAHLKKQLPLERVLDHLGLSQRLKGSGPQKRCACPIHRGDGRGRTFSVNLDEHVFHCHKCKAQGDAIDLWAALHHQTLRQAALDLARTFDLEPAPTKGSEKRNG
jgi:transposase